MEITNNLGLPQAIVSAVKNDPYDKGDCDFSITELIAPPQKKALQKKHDHELKEDASTRLYSLYGQLVHSLLERANTHEMVETRFFSEIGGYKISAQIDSFEEDSGVLTDYKFTTAWHFMASKPAKLEWVWQLNAQRWLLIKNGHAAVNALQIVGLLRDWQFSQSKKNKDYPSGNIAKMKIPILTNDKIERFLRERISLHLAARNGNTTECTEDETFGWKCDLYCSVHNFCPQWARRISGKST